jgi:hypothetical protein
MALIANNSDAFLNGLSDFWHRYFADLGDLRATYEGAAIQFGQAYLDLLHEVLNVSVADAPIFRKEYYRVLPIREDQVAYLQGPPGQYTYAVDAGVLADVPYLQNRVLHPTVGGALEKGIDYQVRGEKIYFAVDPSEAGSAYASRKTVVACGGAFRDSTVPDWYAVGVRKGDRLYADGSEYTVSVIRGSDLILSAKTPFKAAVIGLANNPYSWQVRRYDSDGDMFLIAQSSAATGVIDRTVTEDTVVETVYWGVNVKVDDYTLYQNFGYLCGNKRRSSEAYRAFITGVMQLYMQGPALERMEGALSVIAGLETVRQDGETLTAYSSGLLAEGLDGQLVSGHFSSASGPFTESSVGGYVTITNTLNTENYGTHRIDVYVSPTEVVLDNWPDLVDEIGMAWEYSQTNQQTVTTTQNTYAYPRGIPMRRDVVDPANRGVLTFRAFETLTTAIRVVDYISDPEWWHNITIPLALMPDRLLAENRRVSAAVVPNIIGNESAWLIGDPGFYIGADEIGGVGYPPDKLLYHHRPTFILMDRFLKTHMFSVAVSPQIELTGSKVEDLWKLAAAVKPAYTYALLAPVTNLRDTVSVSDELIRTVR